ncbi:FecR domain-containing protein [Rhodocytophaga aerolata]|uniref:FecR domain-containing protein n=1 Tax=Rhodocytophaga aerolata TaxID=455078 RepID=A0ABT8QYG3_9BACT|nr:FecR domain-containing protein [Rhodocytophaga aerolata]MDO1444709.1 FecR domain-containing protein [Rhodocytophaga aerolata]
MDYSAYTVEDFVSDPYFRKWVENPDQPCYEFWQAFMQQHPEKISTLEDARELVLFLSFDVVQPAIQEQQEVKASILREIRRQKHIPEPTKPAYTRITHLFRQQMYWKAAVLVGILLVAVVVLYQTRQATSIHTAYGQTRIVTLPDGSVVTLNANSTLRYTTNWAKSHIREVWLSGEAFFQVRKKPEWGHAKFTVHTDQLHVEVLGTTFNVNNRRGKVQVVLNTGKVQLQPVNNAQDTITMQPKDLVEFTADEKVYVKKQVNPEEHSAWRNHKLIFNEKSLREIAQVLEDTYGVEVVFSDPALKYRRFTGAIPNHDMNLLLDILSQSMNIQMKKNNQTILIKSE